jgi:dCTP deaminase
MPFWNGEKLLEKLPNLIEGFQADKIDCAAYTLTIGDEVYISPSQQLTTANEQTIRKLDLNEAFVIPPGQFAFLLTHETVTIPDDAIGFISMKARIKFRGLINVSGFHVDPGYRGQLIFAVYNAGPVPVHLQNREPCFLVWYADLSGKSQKVKTGNPVAGLSTELINPIAGELHSFESLAGKIKDVEKDYDKRINSVERDLSNHKTTATVGLTLVVVIFGLVSGIWIKDCLGNSNDQKKSAAAVGVAIPICVPPPPQSANPSSAAGSGSEKKQQEQPSKPAVDPALIPKQP